MATRRLVIVRHAKASHTAGTDFERPLTEVGREQSESIGKAMAKAGLKYQYALISSAKRTRQTWKFLAGKAKPKHCLVEYHDELYGASVSDVVDLVRQLPPEVRTAIVIGHEPTIAATTAYLAGPDSNESAVAQVKVGVPTATWSVLEADGPWAKWGRGKAKLLGVYRP